MSQTIDVDPNHIVLNHEQIQEILPHRYPFLLVDRVVHFDDENYLVGQKNLTMINKTNHHKHVNLFVEILDMPQLPHPPKKPISLIYIEYHPITFNFYFIKISYKLVNIIYCYWS